MPPNYMCFALLYWMFGVSSWCTGQSLLHHFLFSGRKHKCSDPWCLDNDTLLTVIVTSLQTIWVWFYQRFTPCETNTLTPLWAVSGRQAMVSSIPDLLTDFNSAFTHAQSARAGPCSPNEAHDLANAVITMRQGIVNASTAALERRCRSPQIESALAEKATSRTSNLIRSNWKITPM